MTRFDLIDVVRPRLLAWGLLLPVYIKDLWYTGLEKELRVKIPELGMTSVKDQLSKTLGVQ